VFSSLFRLTEEAFSHWKQWRTLQRMLERADLQLRTVEFVYLMGGSAVVFGLFAAVTAPSAFMILLAMVAGGAVPFAFVWFKGNQRITAFENQLPDLLITLAASLKAGHSFKQGLQSVVDEGREPASKELKRVLTEARLGRPMDEALQEMALRVDSKNFDFVITAVTIQRQVGGSLAALIDMVADTVRQRQQFARKIKGLTAMGRASAYVLMGLPFFIAFVITIMNPLYMDPLYNSSTGHKLIATGLAMMCFGAVVLRKIVSFKG
jgi:tight adherence protein B